MSDSLSIKNYPTTLILTIFLGFIGAHRFYAGKVFTGLLFFVTFGFFFIGWLIDIITVSVGNFTDKTGRFIRPRTKTPTAMPAQPAAPEPPHTQAYSSTPEQPATTTQPLTEPEPEGTPMATTPDNATPHDPTGDNQTPVTPAHNTPTTPGEPEQSPARKVPTWLWVVGGVLVLGLIINAFDGGDSDTAADAPQEAPAVVEEAEEEVGTSPEPADEPAEEPEPEPAPSAVFEPIVLEGSGDDIIDVPVITDSIIVATFTHQGSSNFAVVSYNQAGDRISLLVNEIGNHQGTVPFNFSEAPAELEITASGPWSVTLSDLLEQPIYDGSLFEGSGSQVLLVSTDSSRLTATHNGQSNFAILGWGDRRDLLVNEIGPYDGTVRLGNPLALEIKADGQWTLVSQ